ncbi:hypothetical protein AB0H92_09045 [Streptomyces phaeochromogenes]|uniref:hypothetical protein n=1 Tax=Streptomyces phaeochromogenes TaxID=1923 RepID=UPI0033F07AFA
MSEHGAAPPAVDAYPEIPLRRIDVSFRSVPGTTTGPLWRGRLGDVSGRLPGAPADRPAS